MADLDFELFEAELATLCERHGFGFWFFYGVDYQPDGKHNSDCVSGSKPPCPNVVSDRVRARAERYLDLLLFGDIGGTGGD